MYLRNQKEMPVDKNKTGISFFNLLHRFLFLCRRFAQEKEIRIDLQAPDRYNNCIKSGNKPAEKR